jgi:hypothetical protein
MVTAPLLQQLEFEISYDRAVSRALTLPESNRAEAELRRAPASGGGSNMGTVIHFPATQRRGPELRTNAETPESAAVIILPVIRIERYDEPAGNIRRAASNTARRRRRRPATRS